MSDEQLVMFIYPYPFTRELVRAESCWKDASLSTRGALVSQAGRSQTYVRMSWAALPQGVRAELATAWKVLRGQKDV